MIGTQSGGFQAGLRPSPCDLTKSSHGHTFNSGRWASCPEVSVGTQASTATKRLEKIGAKRIYCSLRERELGQHSLTCPKEIADADASIEIAGDGPC